MRVVLLLSFEGPPPSLQIHCKQAGSLADSQLELSKHEELRLRSRSWWVGLKAARSADLPGPKLKALEAAPSVVEWTEVRPVQSSHQAPWPMEKLAAPPKPSPCV